MLIRPDAPDATTAPPVPSVLVRARKGRSGLTIGKAEAWDRSVGKMAPSIPLENPGKTIAQVIAMPLNNG